MVVDEQGALLAPVEAKAQERQRRKPLPKGKRITPELVEQLTLAAIENSRGIAHISALNLAKSISDERPPDGTEHIHVAWVPIKYVSRDFYASIEEAVPLECSISTEQRTSSK